MPTNTQQKPLSSEQLQSIQVAAKEAGATAEEKAAADRLNADKTYHEIKFLKLRIPKYPTLCIAHHNMLHLPKEEKLVQFSREYSEFLLNGGNRIVVIRGIEEKHQYIILEQFEEIVSASIDRARSKDQLILFNLAFIKSITATEIKDTTGQQTGTGLFLDITLSSNSKIKIHSSYIPITPSNTNYNDQLLSLKKKYGKYSNYLKSILDLGGNADVVISNIGTFAREGHYCVPATSLKTIEASPLEAKEAPESASGQVVHSGMNRLLDKFKQWVYRRQHTYEKQKLVIEVNGKQIVLISHNMMNHMLYCEGKEKYNDRTTILLKGYLNNMQKDGAIILLQGVTEDATDIAETFNQYEQYPNMECHVSGGAIVIYDTQKLYELDVTVYDVAITNTNDYNSITLSIGCIKLVNVNMKKTVDDDPCKTPIPITQDFLSKTLQRSEDQVAIIAGTFNVVTHIESTLFLPHFAIRGICTLLSSSYLSLAMIDNKMVFNVMNLLDRQLGDQPSESMRVLFDFAIPLDATHPLIELEDSKRMDDMEEKDLLDQARIKQHNEALSKSPVARISTTPGTAVSNVQDQALVTISSHQANTMAMMNAGVGLWVLATALDHGPLLDYTCREILPSSLGCSKGADFISALLPQSDPWVIAHVTLVSLNDPRIIVHTTSTTLGYILIAAAINPAATWGWAYPVLWSLNYIVHLNLRSSYRQAAESRVNDTLSDLSTGSLDYKNREPIEYYKDLGKSCYKEVLVQGFAGMVSIGPNIPFYAAQDIESRLYAGLLSAAQGAVSCIGSHEKLVNPDKSKIGQAIPPVADLIALVSLCYMLKPNPFKNDFGEAVYGLIKSVIVLTGVVTVDRVSKTVIEVIPNEWLNKADTLIGLDAGPEDKFSEL